MVQPPLRRATHRAYPGGFLVVDIHNHEWFPASNGSVEGGVVAKAKIVAKPNDAGARSHCASVGLSTENYLETPSLNVMRVGR
jgi:hypothetical protein